MWWNICSTAAAMAPAVEQMFHHIVDYCKAHN